MSNRFSTLFRVIIRSSSSYDYDDGRVTVSCGESADGVGSFLIDVDGDQCNGVLQENRISSSNSFSITRRRKLPNDSVKILKRWLFDHRFHAYPDEAEKQELAFRTNLTLLQVSNWFINARRRILPRMLLQDGQEPRHFLISRKRTYPWPTEDIAQPAVIDHNDYNGSDLENHNPGARESTDVIVEEPFKVLVEAAMLMRQKESEAQC